MNTFSHQPSKEGGLPGGEWAGNGPGKQPPPTPVQVNDSRATTSYANFCRITGTPEEVFIDFGINLQGFGQPLVPIEIHQRVVMNYYTAKRLLQVLHLTVQRHEATFGVLETDVQKRVRGGPAGPAGG